MKPAIFVTFGFVAGIICTWAVLHEGPSSHDSTTHPAILPSQASRSNKSDGSIDPTAASPTKSKRPEVKSQEDEMKRLLGDLQGKFMDEKSYLKMVEESQIVFRNKQIDDQVTLLSQHLELSENQANQIRAVLEKNTPTNVFPQIIPTPGSEGGAPSSSPDIQNAPSYSQAREITDQAISQLLDANQKESFDALREQEKTNRIEIATNRDITRLQENLMLTPEQKDRAFQALGDIAVREESQHGVLDAEKARQERLDALRPILTEEQHSRYAALPFVKESNGTISIAPGIQVIEQPVPQLFR